MIVKQKCIEINKCEKKIVKIVYVIVKRKKMSPLKEDKSGCTSKYKWQGVLEGNG